MRKHSIPYDASQHCNIIVPSLIFYDSSKEYRVIVDSALGQAKVCVAFGQVIQIDDTSDSKSSGSCGDKSKDAGTQDSDSTVDKCISPERTDNSNWITGAEEGRKKKKKSFWPNFIDEGAFLTKGSRNYICRESMCNDLNRDLVLRLMKWKNLLVSLVDDVKRKYPFGEESCKEQIAFVGSIGDICTSIAMSGLPLHVMGARKIVKMLDHPKTIQEAELVEDMTEFVDFELTAHMSPCHTTFFVVTTYSCHDMRKHVIYGIFPRYQPREPSPVELMFLKSSKGYKQEG